MPTATDRTRWVLHQGRRIFIVDYSGLRDRVETIALIHASADEIRAQPKRSVPVALLVRGTAFDAQVLKELKDAALGNQPYLRGVCVVGLAGLMKVAHRTMVVLMREEIPAFETEAEALDWLAGRP